jgi:hypothetical protein
MLSQLELVHPPLIKLLWKGLRNLHNDDNKKRIFPCSPKQLTLVYGGAARESNMDFQYVNPNSTLMLSRPDLHISFKGTGSEMTRSQKEKDEDLLLYGGTADRTQDLQNNLIIYRLQSAALPAER